MDYAAARYKMVENQIRTNRVTDPLIIAAMNELPREAFVPETLQGIAYVDEDISLGRGRCLMEPLTTALLMQTAEIGPEMTCPEPAFLDALLERSNHFRVDRMGLVVDSLLPAKGEIEGDRLGLDELSDPIELFLEFGFDTEIDGHGTPHKPDWATLEHTARIARNARMG